MNHVCAHKLSISRASSGIQKQISICELPYICNLHGFLVIIANRQPSNHVLYNDDLQILIMHMLRHIATQICNDTDLTVIYYIHIEFHVVSNVNKLQLLGTT